MPKATFYRHRKELIELGIDINLRKESHSRSNVVLLDRVLEAMPVGIPEPGRTAATWFILQ